jgi:hypothetical protein
MAMREQPDGFPRDRDKAVRSRPLSIRPLRPGGLRAYTVRLTAVEAPEKIVAALMGHKWHRPASG